MRRQLSQETTARPRADFHYTDVQCGPENETDTSHSETQSQQPTDFLYLESVTRFVSPR